MVFPITGGTQDTGYEISNSARFDQASSAYLTRTPSSAGNRKTWTWSGWVKNCFATGETTFIRSWADDNNFNGLTLDSNGQLSYISRTSGSNDFYLNTTPQHRDPSAWYHFVIASDTTQSTASNRVKFYVNGTQITDFDSSTYPDQQFEGRINNNVVQSINRAQETGGSGTKYGHCYMADVNFLDGLAYDPTYFGETDTNGVWIPKQYDGSYGTNGFFLEFQQTGTSANSSGIGADTSGNDHHFTVGNMDATDITEDTPTNNFATLNPLDRAVENASGGITLSEGNCKSVGPNGGNRSRAQSTIGFSSGKWYAEFKIVNGNDHKTQIGMIDEVQSTTNHGGVNAGVEYRTNDDVIYSFTDGSENSNQASLSGISNNDIVGVAINADTSPPSIQFYVNGSTQGSAVTYPNTGSIYFFFVRDGSDSGNDEPEVLCNFGNPPYTISSGNNDGKYGNFEYAPPSGYYALCTKRLAEFG